MEANAIPAAAAMVLDAIGTETPNSNWHWNANYNAYGLTISPQHSGAWLETYIDVQNVARRRLNQHLIDVIGQARDKILTYFLGHKTVSFSDFRDAAETVKPDIDFAARI